MANLENKLNGHKVVVLENTNFNYEVKAVHLGSKGEGSEFIYYGPDNKSSIHKVLITENADVIYENNMPKIVDNRLLTTPYHIPSSTIPILGSYSKKQWEENGKQAKEYDALLKQHNL